MIEKPKSNMIETNEYGNVDIRSGVPKGLAHIPRSEYEPLRISPICATVGCQSAPALVGFEDRGI